MVVDKRRDAFRRITRAFAAVVDNAWDSPLSRDACISRRERAAIKAVFRALVDGASFRGGGYDVLHPDVLGNRFMHVLLLDREAGLKRRAGEFFDDDIISTAVDTRGKYMLVTVMLLLMNGSLQMFHNASSVTWMLREYLGAVASIHTVFKCRRMFVGIPDYLLQYLSPRHLGELRATLATDGNVDTYIDFLDFMIRARASTDAVLDVTQRWMTFHVTCSVPEFVMDGLGYCAMDRVNLYNPYVGARMYFAEAEAEGGRGVYRYVPLDGSYIRGPLRGTNACTDLCAIAVLGIPLEEDPYRHRLFAPDTCADPPATFHDFSRDVSSRPDPNPDKGPAPEPNPDKGPAPEPTSDKDPTPKPLPAPDVGRYERPDELVQSQLRTSIAHVNDITQQMRGIAPVFDTIRSRLSRLESVYSGLRTRALGLARRVDELTLVGGRLYHRYCRCVVL